MESRRWKKDRKAEFLTWYEDWGQSSRSDVPRPSCYRQPKKIKFGRSLVCGKSAVLWLWGMYCAVIRVFPFHWAAVNFISAQPVAGVLFIYMFRNVAPAPSKNVGNEFLLQCEVLIGEQRWVERFEWPFPWMFACCWERGTRRHAILLYFFCSSFLLTWFLISLVHRHHDLGFIP